MTENDIKEKLAREEFRLRSLAEAEEKSKEIAEEIKAVLRIRRVWLGIGFKEQAQSKVVERRKIENVLFEEGIRL